ncbi:MAG: phosphatidylglycerophosphatase A [Desulfobacterota bacterium]|nr:phosphatidylglycerophosphatase A [Thermodesulfobacteriota bacterium]
MDRFILLLGTGLGTGYAPFAPGTMGTLLAIPLYYGLSEIPSPLYELTLAGLFFLSVWVAEKAGALLGQKDDPRIVIDEIMGFFVTTLWMPKTVLFILVGFVLFRFFDILKPPPIRLMEKMRGGYGVVLDDVVAGLYANLLLHWTAWIAPSFQAFLP